jgi:hypothetical protein
MEATVKKTVVALSRKVTRSVPADWGKSELTKFLDIAEEQAHASYAVFPAWSNALELIDRNLTENAPTFFHEIDPPRQTAAKLFLRAFGTYRADCRLALSGQTFEATVLTRSILESGIYAWACAASQPHREAWERRSDGDNERAVARRLFRWSVLTVLLRGVDADLADRIQSVYGQTIEFGAHPNVEGVLLSSEINQLGEDRYEVSTIFLDGEEAVLLAILNLFSAMELVYRLLELTIGDRLRILGIDQRVDEQRRLIVQLIEDFERQQQQGTAAL